MNRFRVHLMHKLKDILESEECRYTDNSLEYFCGFSEAARQRDEEWLREARLPDFKTFLERYGDSVAIHLRTKSALYDLLQDAYSRETLVLVSAYALLGHRLVKFPYNAPGSMDARSRLHDAALRHDDNAERAALMESLSSELGYRPSLYEASLSGTSFNVYSNPVFLYNMAYYNDYCYDQLTPPVDVEPGDYVLDCGACLGDTALSFAVKAGNSGRVYSFEPNPLLGAAFNYNREMNAHLADRITLITAASSDREGSTPLFLAGAGSSCVRQGANSKGQVVVATTTIDHEVDKRRLPKVDFIKMDVEGAESGSLAGARETIRRFRPKLAISVYHSLSDYAAVPEYIDSLGLGYIFYLKHHFVNSWETVLYARA